MDIGHYRDRVGALESLLTREKLENVRLAQENSKLVHKCLELMERVNTQNPVTDRLPTKKD